MEKIRETVLEKYNVKLSIVIATFNAGKTLSRALNSVINQSYQNWECVIIDGASKDKQRDKRIRYISEPDKGIYDAFNKGWKLAKGEWIYYLGADDIITDNGLASLLEHSSKADAIYGDVEVVYNNIRKKYIKSPSPELLGKHLMSHQALIIKRDVIKSLNGFDLQYRICADSDLVLRALSSGYIFYYKNVLVAYFSFGGISNVSTAGFKERFIMRMNHGNENIFLLLMRYSFKYLKNRIMLLFYSN